MTAYDTRAKAQAARMLNTIANGGKGQAVTITRQSAGAYDPATGTAAITTTTQSGTGVELDYTIRELDSTLIQQGDKKLLLSPLNAAGAALTKPEIDDTVTLADSSVWTIKNNRPLSPAGTVILFELQLRRS
jgi:hypothetical protein